MSDGEGEITLTTIDENAYTFTVPKTEIEAFLAARNEDTPPLPTPPEDIEEDVEPPTDWDGGHVRHTGGGIFCREFSREYPDHDVRVEVAYNADTPNGVSIGAYALEDNAWLGEIDHETIDEHTDRNALSTARDLIQRVNTGVYDDEIAAMTPET
ncbi:hypothetical protein [Salinibaculum rarum]|uniref:hypothetical protein n=1 Tax=Salinibaculum rarum TaxID=3058903 RepID=UPI00265FE43F|nr:hypothetical protein [Salinibaculum sp. KK48]